MNVAPLARTSNGVEVDAIIAASAIENNLVLFHRDKDFDLIASCTGLKIFSALEEG